MSELDSIECGLLLGRPVKDELHDDVSYTPINDSPSQSTPQMLYFDSLPIMNRITERSTAFLALPLVFTKAGSVGPGAAYASVDRIITTKNGNQGFITGINSQIANGVSIHQETVS